MSKVYFMDFKIRDMEKDSKVQKIERLCDAAGLKNILKTEHHLKLVTENKSSMLQLIYEER